MVGRWQYTLGVLTPRRDRTSALCRFPEEKTKEHVDATEDEKEESGDEREVVHMLREDCSSDKSLEDTEGTKSKSRTKHRKKAIKESRWPANLRKEKNDHLEDNKQAVDDGPENTANLVGYGAVLDVFTVSKVLRCDIAALLCSFKRVNSFDVGDNDEDAAGKDQYERHYA